MNQQEKPKKLEDIIYSLRSKGTLNEVNYENYKRMYNRHFSLVFAGVAAIGFLALFGGGDTVISLTSLATFLFIGLIILKRIKADHLRLIYLYSFGEKRPACITFSEKSMGLGFTGWTVHFTYEDDNGEKQLVQSKIQRAWNISPPETGNYDENGEQYSALTHSAFKGAELYFEDSNKLFNLMRGV